MVIKYKITGYIIKICFFLISLICVIYQYKIISHNVEQESQVNNLKYILLWTNTLTESSIVFKAMNQEQNIFLINNCPINNCYVTSNKNFLKQITDYDVILFHGPDLNTDDTDLPEKRLPYQKYVFQSLESSGYYPINDEIYDNFFNLTWTYKLDSDIPLGYITIKDLNGKIIGPSMKINWIKLKDMKPISDTLKNELNRKDKMAAWFMSNRWTVNRRYDYVEEMQDELTKLITTFTIDIYGKRKFDKKCPISEMSRCKLMLKSDYYFYLSFENSNCEDYVTEKLLMALQNNVVPVVFGGANYSMFMPDGAYLNARDFQPKELVQEMVDIASNKTRYYDFFRWKNYYSYHDAYEIPETNCYCAFCKKIHEREITDSYKTFRKWWNTPKVKHKIKECKNGCI